MRYPKIGDTVTVMFKWHSTTGIVEHIIGGDEEMPHELHIENVIVHPREAESVTIIKKAYNE